MKPKILFKGFEDDVWISSQFEEIFELIKNNSLSRAELSSEGRIGNIHYGDVLVKYGECLDTSSDSITYIRNDEIGEDLYRRGALKSGDIIFADAAEDNTVGKCSELICNDEEQIVSGLHTIACRPKIEITKRYLGYYLNSNAYHNQLLPHIQGTKVSSISRKAIVTTSIAYPFAQRVQELIATYFCRLDNLISTSTSRLASLKQVKEASLQAMFPQKGETVPKIRFKGFEEEWVNVRLEDIGYCYTGLSGKTKEDFGAGTSWYISFLNVLTNAKIDTTLFEKVNVNKDEHQNEVHKGDLFFNTSSETPEEVGMCSVLDVETKNVYLNSFCFGFRITDNNINPLYIAYLIRSNIGRRIMSVLAQGATRFNLSKSNFYKIEIWVPSCIEEQQKIASYFTSLDRQIALQTQRLEKLRQIKAACLDKMFV